MLHSTASPKLAKSHWIDTQHSTTMNGVIAKRASLSSSAREGLMRDITRCTAQTKDGRRCVWPDGHKRKAPPDGHSYDGIAGKNCTCMLRWYPNRCESHPECNQ